MADLEQELDQRRAINHARQGGKWYSVSRKRKVNYDVRGKIVAYLTEHGPTGTTVIREALAMQSNTISGALCSGCDDGIFVRIAGVNRRSYLYALPGQAQAIEKKTGMVKKSKGSGVIAGPTWRHQQARDILAQHERDKVRQA